MEKVRLGFIGAGGIAGFHFSHLERMEDVGIVAVTDAAEERARQAGERFNAQIYPSARALLQDAAMDAVYVCVPPFAHGEPEWLALERGLPLFVEKPVHLDLEDATRIARAIEEKGLVSSVGYQGRYADIVDRMKSYLSTQEVGMLVGYWMGGMPGVAWWRRKEESGGQIVEQTTHVFDTARYLFGEVSQVCGAARTGLMTEVPDYNVEDASAVILNFQSGLVGVMFSACCLQVGGRVGMDIFCKHARLEYQERSSLKIIEPHATLEARIGNDIGFEEDRIFIDAVKSGDGAHIRSTYSDAARTLAITLAATRAVEEGGVVQVPRI